MILIFEQDLTVRNGSWWNWRPNFFIGPWRGCRLGDPQQLRTWRLGWGIWSLSYYPSPGLRKFFETAEEGQWYGSAEDAADDPQPEPEAEVKYVRRGYTCKEYADGLRNLFCKRVEKEDEQNDVVEE